MLMLPYMDVEYAALTNESPQTCKYLFGEKIRNELFLWRFISRSEEAVNLDTIFDDFYVYKAHKPFDKAI